MKEYQVLLEREVSGLDLKGYVFVERQKSIMNEMWINYGLNKDDLKEIYASRIVLLTQPSRLSLDIILLPSPDSLHEDYPGAYFTAKVKNEDFDDEPDLRNEHFLKLRPVKLVGVAGYNPMNKKSIDAIVHTLVLHGFKAQIKDGRRKK